MKNRKFFSSERTVIFGFSALILLGAMLLMLPISSNGGMGFIDALFTATSSSCVTGLVVKDTATYFTVFGKIVIMLMIQIGGMGVVTMAVLAAIISGRRIGLNQRSIMQNSISAPKIGGIIKLTGFIVKVSLSIEFLGAAALCFPFCKSFGIKGVWYAVFHSVSAFCNAGFDIIDKKQPFSSFCEYSTEPVINVTFMLLIIIGGIGFMTWDDIKNHKFRLRRYSLQSKVVLTVTAILVFLPAIFFFLFEFADLPTVKRIWVSLFQSVTLRTAGFNTVSFDKLSDSGKLIMIAIMLVGGAPGSTAGGMKVTTVAVMFFSVMSVFKRKNSAEAFGRRIPDSVIKNAAAIFFLYLTLFVTGAVVISMVESLPLIDCLFETSSAIATVGLTVGITSSLSAISKIILIALMFLGRVGGLTIVFATVSGGDVDTKKLPQEKITVG